MAEFGLLKRWTFLISLNYMIGRGQENREATAAAAAAAP